MTVLPTIPDAPRGSRVSWIYGGVWGILAHAFLVPQEPPGLPSVSGEPVRSFRPAPNFLRYLMVPSLILLGIIAFAVLGVGLAATAAEPAVGVPLLAIGLIAMLAASTVTVISIYLRYDTTWYVLSDRSLRIRRGIWIIRETTITFENIQNVTVQQGPLQRLFGIADVRVDTAGGGGGGPHSQHGGGASMHQGLIEGMSDAPAIRDLLTAKMRASRSAGLGDEAGAVERRSPSAGWTPEHVAALREIREAALALT